MLRLGIASIIAGLVLSGSASAHKMLLSASVQADRLRVEVFYDDDSPAGDARIVVEDAQKREVTVGTTDLKGTWSCPKPVAGEYTIRAESAGHRAKELVTVVADSVGQERSFGADRAEETEVPWLMVALGLGIITTAFGLYRWFVGR